MGVVSTPDDGAVAASHAVDPASWRELFDELMSLVAGRFHDRPEVIYLLITFIQPRRRR